MTGLECIQRSHEHYMLLARFPSRMLTLRISLSSGRTGQGWRLIATCMRILGPDWYS